MKNLLSFLPIIVIILSIPFWLKYYSTYLDLKEKGSENELKIGINKIIKKMWLIIGVFIVSAIISAAF